jgi:hypothetical protein
MAKEKNQDKIFGTIHLANGETLSEGQEDELKDALGEQEAFQTDGEPDDTKITAELQRLAEQQAIQGFGTVLEDETAESEGEDPADRPKASKRAGKRGRPRKTAK